MTTPLFILILDMQGELLNQGVKVEYNEQNCLRGNSGDLEILICR